MCRCWSHQLLGHPKWYPRGPSRVSSRHSTYQKSFYTISPCIVRASCLPVSHQEDMGSSHQEKKGKKKRRFRFSKIEMESMEMLQWKNVCKQIASFAKTPAAAQKAYTGKLEVGETLAESVLLMEQTKEAMMILDRLDFTGIYDIRNAMDAACRGVVLHPLVIGAFATTLESIQKLAGDLEDPTHGHKPVLSSLLAKHKESIMNTCLPDSIRSTIHVGDGRIYDDASDVLKRIRLQKRDNLEKLTKGAEEWSRRMHACGASERPQVVIRRSRRCIPIKAGRNGELPDGSVTLGTSGSGSTMYTEPAPLVPLNNVEIQLTEEEKAEEEKILESLSQMIRSQSGVLKQIIAAVTKLDLACARAEHARWIRGTMPHIFSSSQKQIECRSVVHPLLIEPFLSPLPHPRLPQKVAHLGDSMQGSALEGINLIPELWDRNEDNKRSSSSSGSSTEDEEPQITHDIQPIDIIIPQDKAAVIVTGPNTGGKTASLKTFGLLSLMAKSGMSIPTSEPSLPVQLCWFDKILVDVGDAQNLQQNLSTFSGHVKRIKSILLDTSPESLVLLDEVGSGTDPTEGAAFALAILDSLAHGGAAMTYATTHHAELKEVASRDSLFINANVEFNVKTFLPTYRVIWGQSGESHALAVAEGLGFDSKVIEEARATAQNLKERSERQFLQIESLKESLPNQISAVESRIQASKRHILEHKAALQDTQARLGELKQDIKNLEQGEVPADHVFEKINEIVRDATQGDMSIADASQALSVIAGSARSAAEATLAELYDDGPSSPTSTDWVPAVGDQVAILSMAGRVATVESINMQKKKATVRAGSMVIGDVAFCNLRRQEPPKPRKRSTQGTQELASSPQQQTPSLPAIQTSQNTVDVRGESSDDAVSIVQDAIGTSRPGAVMFVIHGVGTGRVRAAVLSYLRKAPRVVKAEQHEGSGGGCTVVYVD